MKANKDTIKAYKFGIDIGIFLIKSGYHIYPEKCRQFFNAKKMLKALK